MSEITPQPDPSPGIRTELPSLASREIDPDIDARSTFVFPLHPSFWWAILWCVFMMLMTQLPAGIIAIVVMFVLSKGDPGALRDLTSHPVRTGIVVAVVVAHSLIILLALLCLRMIAGRDWMRQVALRLPSLRHVLLTFAIWPAFLVLGSAVEVMLKQIDYPSATNPSSTAAFWAALLGVLLLVASLHLFCRLIGGRGWYDEFITPLSFPVKTALSCALLLLLIVSGVVAYWSIRPLADDLLPGGVEMSGMEEMIETFKSLTLASAIAVIAVMPALSEELWCRAFLGRGLVGRHGIFWGVLMTSFLFGAIHGDPRQGTYAMLLGVILHVTYLASRSLLIPMLLHFLNNALAIVLLQFSDVVDLDAVLSSRFSLLPVMGAVVLLTTGLYAFWRSRVRIEGLWNPPYPGVVCPPPESDTRLVMGGHPWTLAGVVGLALVLFGLMFYLAVRMTPLPQ